MPTWPDTSPTTPPDSPEFPSEEPDVIALQETQRKEGYDQVELIAGSLGYEHYFHDSTSESHIDTDCRLGHCVISKYPISQHRFGLFENPDAQVTWEDGSTATTHDKGFSSCVVSIGDTQIEVTTLHLIPFRGLASKSKRIVSGVRTDHYPVIATFAGCPG